MKWKSRPYRYATAWLLATALALTLPAAAGTSTAAGPATSPVAAPSPIPKNGQLPYYDDPLMRLLFMVRVGLAPTMGGSAYAPEKNAAFTLVDPTGLDDATLLQLAKRNPEPKAPPVFSRVVPLDAFKDYLPPGVYQKLQKAGTRHLVMVGGMSFRAYSFEDHGSHSEPLITGELDKLRKGHLKAKLTELVWGSDRDYCEECREIVAPKARRFHVAPYALTAKEIANRAKEIAAATAKHTTEKAKAKAAKPIETKYKNIRKQRGTMAVGLLRGALTVAKQKHQKYGQAQAEYEEMTQDIFQALPGCPENGGTKAQNSSYSVHKAAFTVPRVLPQAGPCPEDEPSRASGLAKALADPHAAPGGIDFSTLELRYLADPGKGLKYAFSADPGGAGKGGNAAAGVTAAREASDAFFVWLSLPPSAFWVNLNPTEPDRVVDPALGRTDAGRILLQADLQLKKTTGRLIHPDSSSGKRFWGAVSGRCMSFRTWIVPAPASVSERDNQLYILDAPLSVKMESQYLSGQGSKGAVSCDERDPAAEKRNEQAFRRLILPRIEQAVNHAPEYAGLRRVYLSRVAAEWYRQLDRRTSVTYSDLIGRGDVSRWVTRTSWKPVDTFNQYVRSYREGEFNITRRTRSGNYLYTKTYVFGGVDFARVNLTRVKPASAFRDEWAGMPRDAGLAASADLSGAGASHVWLGGDTTSPTGGADTAPQKPAVTVGAGQNGGDNSVWLAALALASVVGVALLLKKGFGNRRGNNGNNRLGGYR
ncbi:hypothetical protein [Streptomyces sp. NPDC000410]|uniref:hypothetical protein n=1 Tax=Streptomyces sp. NPDC000410 TaxID=3154254 RepID=UPI003319787B